MSASGLKLLAEEIRAQIGKRFTPTGKRLNEVSEHFVRNWAYAIDERDPVYWDAAAAKAAGYDGLRVPPSFIYMVARGPSYEMYTFPPDVISLFGEQEYEFLADLHVGDRITAEAHITGVRETGGDTLGPLLLVFTQTDYTNQNAVRVAIQRQTSVLYTSDEALQRTPASKPAPITVAVPESEAEPVDDRPALEAQRFLDEVAVGDELGPFTLGPLRIDQFVRFVMVGGLPPPGEDPAAVHYDPWYAAKAGLKDVVDMGAWRTALFIQLAQAWGGPAARVRKIRNRYGDFVYRSDMLRFCGRATATRVQDGRGEIDLDIWNDKNEGTVVTTGTLTVALPLRSGAGIGE